jgi:hypothetical protein
MNTPFYVDDYFLVTLGGDFLLQIKVLSFFEHRSGFIDGLYVMQIINSELIRVHRIWALRN